MSRVAPLVAAAASTTDVRFGFFLCGAGKPRRGWFRVRAPPRASLDSDFTSPACACAR